MELTKALFWDTDYNQLSWEKHAQFVIVRVVSRGKLNDWKAIIQYYGATRIQQALQQARYLDDKTLHFASAYFDIPKTDFRCYTTKPSTQQLWNSSSD